MTPLLLLVLAAPDLRKDVATCAAMTSDATRLACFDRAAKGHGLVAKTKQVKGAGKWKVETEVSPIDDRKIVVLSVLGDKQLRGWPGRAVRPKLMIRCKERDVEVFVGTGMTAAGETTSVRIRYDKEDVETEDWFNSTNGESLFMPVPQGPYAAIRKMTRHDSMLFEITPYNSSPTMTTFDIRGLQGLLGLIAEACELSPDVFVEGAGEIKGAEVDPP